MVRHAPSEAERAAAGWTKRFVADGPRAAETVALYEALGFEVVADPMAADPDHPECDDCRLVELLRFTTIYTRRREGSAT